MPTSAPVFNNPAIETEYRDLSRCAKQYLVSEYLRNHRVCDEREVRAMAKDALVVELLTVRFGSRKVDAARVCA